MAEFYEVVNKIIENDLNDEPSEQEEVAEEREAQDTRYEDDSDEDKMIEEANAELDEIKLSRELFSDIKILNYDKYINPENDKERRVTMLKVVFNPKMNYPFTFTVANGWGQPLITKQKGVVIKEGSVRFVDTVTLSIDEKNLLPMLKRVEVFIQAMTTHGTAKY